MRWMGFLAACLVVAAACAADSDGDGPGDTVDAGGGADGGMSGGACEGPGDCRGGQDCSVTGRCIPEGTCIAGGDCPDGESCGMGSRVCLGEGECAAEGDCGPGLACDLERGQCAIGGDCGTSEFGLERLPPNMMILLDRSGSMDNEIDGRTRWDIAKDAIETVTTRFDADIRFGLATYSSCEDGGCSAGSIVVAIADGNASAVNDFLAPLRGEGSNDGSPPRYLCDSGDPETSTGKSLFALVGESSLQDPARENAVLLVTDGQESGSCTEGGDETGPKGAAALLAQDPSVRTFVVGFSEDAPAGELNAVASAGGTGTYYSANDAAALTSAFESIAGEVASCDFALDSAPPDPDMLFVYFDDDPSGIPRDGANGWSYDGATMTLRFHGTACDQITAGSVGDIDVVYGCEGPVLE